MPRSLPDVVYPPLISLFDIHVRPGDLARLPLLFRSRDVGHRDLLCSAVVFLQPEAAEGILGYRVRNLEAARSNARLMGDAAFNSLGKCAIFRRRSRAYAGFGSLARRSCFA